jgi:mannose-6-phosphate isomerase-like protein (cupin superfamily)
LLGGLTPHDTKLAPQDTNGQLFIAESSSPAGNSALWSGPPLHVHRDEDEWWYVIEGQVHFQVGTERFILGPGESMFGPRGVPHGWARRAGSRMLEVFQPAGKMERYFIETAKLGRQATPDEQHRLFTAHNMRIVGPPLAVG